MLEDLLQKRQMIYDKTLKGLKVQCRFSETIFLKKTLKTALNTFFFFFLNIPLFYMFWQSNMLSITFFYLLSFDRAGEKPLTCFYFTDYKYGRQSSYEYFRGQ